jgi:hypothetical protein
MSHTPGTIRYTWFCAWNYVSVHTPWRWPFRVACWALPIGWCGDGQDCGEGEPF